MNRRFCSLALLAAMMLPSAALAATSTLEQDFRTLPMTARRLTGPLFWLHGDESKERLDMMVGKVVAGGNGTFTPESRPHSDWLGPTWYRDLGICLDAAKRGNLTMWIFDERWWPSGEVGGKVPVEYASKFMKTADQTAEGPAEVKVQGCGTNLIAVIAGRETADGVQPDSLIDLTPRVSGDTLTWSAPSGKWKIMTFTWDRRRGLVDGASKDCVDWYIRTVYQPHYDHFSADFGKTIKGFFYDEPETRGDWGTEVITMLKSRGVDWKKALVAYKFQLAGDEQTAAKYQYYDSFAETWGKTFYGGLQDWCTQHNVVSMGHFLEHDQLYLSTSVCGGNMFQLQKYSGMGGIDLVCQQMYPGQRPFGIYQTPKLGSSITHAYGMKDDITMCEMFGAYGQNISYPQMKWLTDQMQVRGVNYMVPHSFNPRAPYDDDCPPYFDNGGFEPRWPLYRVYADYTSRLSLMLSGGKHVCPIAFLFLGNSAHAGKYVTPENMTSAIQDATYDCDWIPYDVFGKSTVKGGEIGINSERYRVLVVPPVEVIPYETLARVKAFFDAGGVVIGYGYLPSKSATIGKGAGDIAKLTSDIWGSDAKPALVSCRTSAGGGKAYFLSQEPSAEDILAVLHDAGVRPGLEVSKGETNHWLHVLHRVKDGRDVFFVCNQNWNDAPRRFTFRVNVPGIPEAWDAMRGEINSVDWRRSGQGSTFDITLQPSESVLIVMNPERRTLPMRLDGVAMPLATAPVTGAVVPAIVTRLKTGETSVLDGCAWVWASQETPPGKTFYRRHLSVPAGRTVKSATFLGTCDNELTLYVNGKEAGKTEGSESWRSPATFDISKLLTASDNVFAIEGRNLSNAPNPAGLIGRCSIVLDNGDKLELQIDTTWKSAVTAPNGWQQARFDDSSWRAPVKVADFGGGPWGNLGSGGRLTVSPVSDKTFRGAFTLPTGVDVSKSRVCLEAESIAPEAAANIAINGRYVGGFIERPFRLDIGAFVKKGRNTVTIAPFAPDGLRLAVYPK